MIQLKTSYLNLFEKLTGQLPLNIVPIPVAGSMRSYFRFIGDTHQYIGTFNENIEENNAFFSFSKTLFEIGINVPKVEAVSEDGKFYLQTDFGDNSLFDLLTAEDAYTNPLTRSYLFIAVEQLVLMQLRAKNKIDFSVAWPTAEFSFKTILDDLYYFKYYFLKMLPGFVFNEYRLDKEFEDFAFLLSSVPSDYFMYRDFQSRNIMIQEGSLAFIDFQGARKGPLQYDLVSMLYQVRAAMPEQLRQELITHYMTHLNKFEDAESLQFKKYLPYFIYFRLLQVMGAYGYRGLIQNRPHFLKSIPYAIQSLKQQLQLHPLASDFPYLSELLQSVSDLKTYEDFSSEPIDALQISLSSFSFIKGGIPIDYSGNGGGHVFDCRPLPNPGREAQYKRLTGLDQEVKEYLEKHKVIEEFFENVSQVIALSVDNYLQRNFKNLKISFGCTGGQHRSVYFAERCFAWLKEKYPNIVIKLEHWELDIQKHT